MTDLSISLAPMAGVTDFSFRTLARRHGAVLTFSEMVSAKGLMYNSKKTWQILERDGAPFAVQLFGHDPKCLADAAGMVDTDMIDINMGCPAPKITGNGDGAALMKDARLAASIVYTVKSNVNVPVSVKIRAGWDIVNAVPFAKELQSAGADVIIVHPRLKVNGFSGAADLSVIRDVVNAVNIPVIGNGDIRNRADAVRMKAETNCAGIMIGRGAYGRPWIFSEINDPDFVPPAIDEQIDIALEGVITAAEKKGEHIAVLEARKHISRYFKAIRNDICKVNSITDIRECLEKLRSK